MLQGITPFFWAEQFLLHVVLAFFVMHMVTVYLKNEIITFTTPSNFSFLAQIFKVLSLSFSSSESWVHDSIVESLSFVNLSAHFRFVFLETLYQILTGKI